MPPLRGNRPNRPLAQPTGGLVYSTHPELVESEPDPSPAAPAKKLPIIRIEIDKKRRRGKTVTVLSGFDLRGDALDELARKLKQRCGAGGTVGDDRAVEIQGDHRTTLKAAIETLGYRTKVIG